MTDEDQFVTRTEFDNLVEIFARYIISNCVHHGDLGAIQIQNILEQLTILKDKDLFKDRQTKMK